MSLPPSLNPIKTALDDVARSRLADSSGRLQTQYASRRTRMEEDPTKISELSQADHTEFRDRFVRSHPDVIFIDAKEPHKKFVERLPRDSLMHEIVRYYEPAEIRARSDVIIVKSAFSRNAEDLLSIAKADQRSR